MSPFTGSLDESRRPRQPAQGLRQWRPGVRSVKGGALSRDCRVLHPPFQCSRSQFSLALSCARLTLPPQLTAKALPRLDEDERLLPILSHLSMGFMAGIGSEYTVPTGGDGEELTAEMVPGLSTASFPFCMRSLQDALKGSGHLKHEGRHMYNLFLKVRSRCGFPWVGVRRLTVPFAGHWSLGR